MKSRGISLNGSRKIRPMNPEREMAEKFSTPIRASHAQAYFLI